MSLLVDQVQVQALFRRFAAPLASLATSFPSQKETLEIIASNLWIAMIAGPEIEDMTWQILKTIGNLDDVTFQVIQQIYSDKMKPSISGEELGELRRRLQSRRYEVAAAVV